MFNRCQHCCDQLLPAFSFLNAFLHVLLQYLTHLSFEVFAKVQGFTTYISSKSFFLNSITCYGGIKGEGGQYAWRKNTTSISTMEMNYSAREVKGPDGTVSKTFIRSGTLDEASKRSFPVEPLVIMRRQAVDLLLDDNNQKGRGALKVIVILATGRNGFEDIKNGKLSETA